MTNNPRRRHALVFNAITHAITGSGQFVPLQIRDAAARAVLEALGTDDGLGWTRAIPDSKLVAVRMSCGHAKLAIRNIPVMVGASTLCHTCGDGVTITSVVTESGS